MSVALVSTGVQFPDATIQTTAASASKVVLLADSSGSAVSNFYLAPKVTYGSYRRIEIAFTCRMTSQFYSAYLNYECPTGTAMNTNYIENTGGAMSSTNATNATSAYIGYAAWVNNAAAMPSVRGRVTYSMAAYDANLGPAMQIEWMLTTSNGSANQVRWLMGTAFQNVSGMTAASSVGAYFSSTGTTIAYYRTTAYGYLP